MTEPTGGPVPRERLHEIQDALGMSRTRGWDDVLNAAECLRRQDDAHKAHLSPLRGEPVELTDEEKAALLEVMTSPPRLTTVLTPTGTVDKAKIREALALYYDVDADDPTDSVLKERDDALAALAAIEALAKED